MVLYFGKYKGQSIEDVPLSYLVWLWEKVKLTGKTRDAVKQRLTSFSQQQPPIKNNMIGDPTAGVDEAP